MGTGTGSASAGAAPGRRVTWAAVALLGGLLAIQVAAGGQVPLALAGVGILGFAVICAVRLEAAFLLVLAATPFSTPVFFRGAGAGVQVPSEPMILIALAAWTLRTLARGSTGFAHPALVGALLLALGSCLLSFLATPNLVATAKGTANAAWYALFGLFLANNLADRRIVRASVIAWLVPSVLLTLYSFGHVLAGHYNRWAGYFWGEPFFYDHGTFSAYLSFGFSLALAMTLELRGKAKLGLACVATLLGAQVILSMTRGAWIGLAALVPFLLIATGHRLRQTGNVLLLAGAAALLVFSVSFLGLSGEFEKHTNTITDTSYTSNLERVNRWLAGWKMFTENPLTGVGYGAYQDEYLGHQQFVVRTVQSRQRMGVHSEYLRVLAETGLPGFLAALLTGLIVAGLARRAIRNAADPLLRAIAVGMAGGLVTYLTHAMVNNYIELDKAAVPVWAAVGTLAALATLAGKRGDSSAPVPDAAPPS